MTTYPTTPYNGDGHLDELYRILEEKGLTIEKIQQHIGFAENEYGIEDFYQDFLNVEDEQNLEEYVEHTMRPRPVQEHKVIFTLMNFYEDGQDITYIPHIDKEFTPDFLNNVKNVDEIVIAEPSITILFNYPLNNDYYFTFMTDGTLGFTRGYLLRCIVDKYIEIYQEEEDTLSQHPVIPVNQRVGLLNRNQTDGKYGIWGHDLNDLSLNYVYKYQEEIFWRLSIDS